MDGRRFDEVTKTWGRGASRRGVLAALAGAALGLLGRSRAGAQSLPGTGDGWAWGEACNAVTCGMGEYCCNWSCSTCAPLGGVCTALYCVPGPPTVCLGAGEPCGLETGGCCAGLTCAAGDPMAGAGAGVCAAPKTPAPIECQTAADCPQDDCNNIACQDGRCISTLMACP
ncbi:MAG: hypothetical protein AVDCRST_MAG59-2895 [uncultured Thermomicrobiales bacterium]|uniref:Uncharacterized protein n=1 Tax=uncultured Thermomicrobiales bacterium TaxID=1645740 RepID=A0A6J4V4Q3_9BACT|nr:MAG: hypothetical protein AVDCRST_MAG59-2895 [uncultured Thermomicrobiales bacterium]